MTRSVRQTNVAPDKPEDARPRSFDEFRDRPNLVLLGDPGAGKTHLLREVAKAEGATLLTARAFLVTPPNRLLGQSLYIDGLDEKRAGRGDRDTVDALVEKLFAANPPRVRISCRAGDWLGNSDLAALCPYFEQHGEPAVLLLESLTSDEQRAVLSDQGVDRSAAITFLAQAEERGLSGFLENPQNLIMFWRAVHAGSWPATRKELFELSTGLMLQEYDPDRARTGAGVFSVAELRPVAGAICAARLISDIDAISLTDQEGTKDFPGYRLLTFLDPEKIRAALGRRIFVAGSEPETVDYAHRTTAEYLAASFLAARVREGLPLGRVAALIGVDGYPAPELRGLHAWLAVHLPEFADQLINADPYGVLTYGDAASLSPSSCGCLIRALDRLSKTNPWFRSGKWQAWPIGALARRDMIPYFRAVLNDANAGFSVRSVIVDALSLGAPIPEMLDDLKAILARETSPLAERLGALAALVRLGDVGKAGIVAEFQTRLARTANALRLRVAIIEKYYGCPFGADDVVLLVNDSLNALGALGTGHLSNLADHFPLIDAPAILDGILPSNREIGFDKASIEAASFYTRLLSRAVQSPGIFDPGRAFGWLQKRLAFRGAEMETRTQNLRATLESTPDRVRAIAAHFFQTLSDTTSFLAFHRFREAILFLLTTDELLDLVVERLDGEHEGSDKQVFFYELAFNLAYGAEQPRAGIVFDKLYALADQKAFLAAARSRCVVANLPDRYFQGRSSQSGFEEESRDKQRQEFAEAINDIRTGAHLGWIQHLGQIYFGLYLGSDREISPHQRLSDWLGQSNLKAAVEGLSAALSRSDVPTFDDVMKLAETHEHYPWWHALVAGLNERWSLRQGLAGLSADFIKALVAFDLMNPVSALRDGTDHWLVHPWKEALLQENPELVRDVYLAVVRLKLSSHQQFADGLRELLTQADFEPYREDIVLELLRDFPNTELARLEEMLDTVTKLPQVHRDFLELAGQVLSGRVTVEERQRDIWLVTSYLLLPSAYESDVERRAQANPSLIFDLRDRGGFTFRGRPTEILPLHALEFMARLTGMLFQNAAHPPGGWSGDRNVWDASEHFGNLINMISTMPSEAATNVLKRFEANPDLASHRRGILLALANQQQRRRDAEYVRPDWPKTVAALANGAPATAADLHALLIAHTLVLKVKIERENTDNFKMFWNVDQHARPDTPRPEEACRDYLITLMRPWLLPLGIMVEPEGHMVADKRADISAATPVAKVLFELKRDYHAEVWTAVEGQLVRFYTPDPGAGGYGIYCVFWFGDNKHPVPAPPGGLGRPTSAPKMEQMLKDLMPEVFKNRVAVVVIDVSGSV